MTVTLVSNWAPMDVTVLVSAKQNRYGAMSACPKGSGSYTTKNPNISRKMCTLQTKSQHSLEKNPKQNKNRNPPPKMDMYVPKGKRGGGN